MVEIDSKQNLFAIFGSLEFACLTLSCFFYRYSNVNVGGKMFDWIQDFLRDRKIQVKVNNMKSPLTVVEEGLPQGSSLSCMLFIVFLNRVSAMLDKHADKGL